MHLADRELAWSPLNRPPAVSDPTRVDWGGRTRVVIYGAGYGKHEAPLMDPAWVVWALNLVPPMDDRQRVRADAWFDLHQRVAQTADDLRWIAKCPVPIFVPPDLADAGPTCVAYPLDAVEAAYGSYFACTFAYQIGLAMLHGFTDIGLYGVELAYGTPRERTVEWASTSWWLGYAEARGVRFHLPFGSRLCAHPHRYGFEYRAEIDDVERYLDDWERGAERPLAGRGAASVGG